MKNKTSLTRYLGLVFCLFLQLMVSAQWKVYDNPFNSTELYHVQALSFDTVVVGVYNYGTTQGRNELWKSVDEGKNWKNIGYNYSSFHFMDNTRGVMSTVDTVFRTENGGLNWVPIAWGYRYILGTQRMDDSTFIFHCNTKKDLYQLYVSRDSGKSWTYAKLPYDSTKTITPHITNLDVSNNTITVVAEYANTDIAHVYISKDYGKSWKDIDIGRKLDIYRGGNRLKVLDDSIFFFVSFSEIEISRDNGKNWDTTNFFLKGKYTGATRLEIFNRDYIVASCSLSGDRGRTFAVSRDQGKSWNWMSCSDSTNRYNFVEQVSMADTSIGYAVAWRGIVKYDIRNCPTSFSSFDLGNDTSSCEEYTIDVGSVKGANKYVWNTGDTTSFLKIKKSGTYSVTLSESNVCRVTDSINITINNAPDVELMDSIVCDSVFKIDPGNYDRYLWSNGSTKRELIIDSSNTYSVEVFDSNGCSSIASANYEIIKPFHLDLGADINRDKPFSIKLESDVKADKYLWSTGDSSSFLIVSDWGIYTLKVEDHCSTQNDTIVVGYCEAKYGFLHDSSTKYTTNFVNKSNGDDLEILWDLGDGTFDTATNVTHSYNSFGEFQVCLSVQNKYCQSKICDSIKIDSLICPKSFDNFNFGLDTSNCGEYILDVSNVKEANSIHWSTNDTTKFITVKSTGEYWVHLSNGKACEASDTIKVEIFVQPKLELSDTLVCDSSVKIDPGKYESYYWSDNTTNRILNVDSSGTYSLQVYDSNGCFAQDSFVIELINPIQLDLGEDLVLDKPFTKKLEAKVIADSYLWNTGDTTENISVNSWGEYSVKVEDKCTIQYDTVLLGFCDASFKFYKDTSTKYAVTLVDSSSGVNLDYIWNFGDGDTSHSQYPTHDYNSFGKYEVCLTVQNDFCSSNYCDSIGMDSSGKLYKNQGFSIIVKSWKSVSILESQSVQDGFKIYPNPTKGVLYIRNPNGALPNEYFVRLYDMFGRQIPFEVETKNSEILQIKVDNSVSGAYVLFIGGADVGNQSQIILIE